VTRIVFTVQIRSPEDVEETAPHADVQNVQYQHAGYDEALGEGEAGSSLASRPRPGRRSAATIPVPAVPARNTSTATENCPDLTPRHPTVP
jgi:preprotein translocase subunit SecA